MKLSPTRTNQSLSSHFSLKQWAAETRTLGVRMVAAHMKYASPDSRLRKRLASQGKVPEKKITMTWCTPGILDHIYLYCNNELITCGG